MGMAGFGVGVFQAPNNRVMIGEVPRRRSGAAAGMMAVSRLIGQTLGALAAAFAFRLCGAGSVVPLIAASGLGVAGAFAAAARKRQGS